MEQDEEPEVGRELRALRGERPKKTIADQAGIDPGQWSRMESGEQNISEKAIDLLDAAGLLTRAAKRRLDAARRTYRQTPRTPIQRLEAKFVELAGEVALLRSEVDELRRPPR